MKRRTPPARPIRFIKESVIHAAPEEVFRFHERPDALTLLIPPWEKTEVIQRADSLKVGSRVVLQVRQGPLRLKWVAMHTEYEPPHLFADQQESGPFAYWYHQHRILPDGRGGTVLRDEIEYRLPGGRIAQWIAGGLIRRKLERMFAYRHEVTRRETERR